jgi:hypothetical protein
MPSKIYKISRSGSLKMPMRGNKLKREIKIKNIPHQVKT